MRPRVLLADDYQGLLDAWQRLLKPSCEIVGTARNGRQVLDAAVQLQPDVVVVDLSMPEMNGFEVCRRIAAVLPRTKVILATASDTAEIRGAAFAAGAAAFVVKHLAADELEGAIRRAVGGAPAQPDR